MPGKKIAIIGYGFIGSTLYKRVNQECNDVTVSWVYNRSVNAVQHLPGNIVLEKLEHYKQCPVDLIVEVAHPKITEQYGALFLQDTDYMPVSVNGLADMGVLAELERVAKRNRTHLYIPHGALMGVDSLLERRHVWNDVTITLKKNTNSINFSNTDVSVTSSASEQVLYDGNVQGIYQQFPQNVNMMVACALATVGVDKCRAKLISDPTLDCGIAEVEALGEDGSRLFFKKQQPMVGVSGSEMCDSIFYSVLRALNCYEPVKFV